VVSDRDHGDFASSVGSEDFAGGGADVQDGVGGVAETVGAVPVREFVVAG
jgi:hypothetical protein